MVALRTPRLRELTHDEELVALRLLTDRRDELSHLRVQTVNRLHRLLTELIPGGAKRDLSALQAKRQHIDPDGPLPGDGILDDPYEFLASPLAGGPARLWHRGYLATGYPLAGTGFMVWHGSAGHLVAHSLSSNAAAKLPAHADGGAVTSDGGHLVAYGTAGSTGTSVTVARVTLPH